MFNLSIVSFTQFSIFERALVVEPSPHQGLAADCSYI